MIITMCVALWTANVRAWQNPLPQTAHLNGLSLEWIYLKNNIKRYNLTLKVDLKYYTFVLARTMPI